MLIGDRWLGIFNGVSAFNNSGMSLLDANLVRVGKFSIGILIDGL